MPSATEQQIRIFTMNSKKESGGYVVHLLVMAVLLTGCTSMEAVRDFSKLAEDSTASFPAIAVDVQESCQRRAEYEPIRPDCGTFEKSKQAMLNTHWILIDYMNALGTLAADGIVVYRQQLGEFAEAVEEAGAFEPAQVAAVNGLANTLATAATSGYQRRQVREVIDENNQNVQQVIGALKITVNKDYRRTLNLEREAIDSYYGDAIEDSRRKEPLAVLIAEEVKEEKIARVEQKEAVIDDYLQVLDKISQGHQALFDHREDLSSRELVVAMVQYARQLRDNVNALSRAF